VRTKQFNQVLAVVVTTLTGAAFHLMQHKTETDTKYTVHKASTNR